MSALKRARLAVSPCAPPPPPSTATALACDDLIACILRFVPCAARVVVCARVCTTWNDAVSENPAAWSRADRISVARWRDRVPPRVARAANAAGALFCPPTRDAGSDYDDGVDGAAVAWHAAFSALGPRRVAFEPRAPVTPAVALSPHIEHLIVRDAHLSGFGTVAEATAVIAPAPRLAALEVLNSDVCCSRALVECVAANADALRSLRLVWRTGDAAAFVATLSNERLAARLESLNVATPLAVRSVAAYAPLRFDRLHTLVIDARAGDPSQFRFAARVRTLVLVAGAVSLASVRALVHDVTETLVLRARVVVDDVNDDAVFPDVTHVVLRAVAASGAGVCVSDAFVARIGRAFPRLRVLCVERAACARVLCLTSSATLERLVCARGGSAARSCDAPPDYATRLPALRHIE